MFERLGHYNQRREGSTASRPGNPAGGLDEFGHDIDGIIGRILSNSSLLKSIIGASFGCGKAKFTYSSSGDARTFIHGGYPSLMRKSR
jgi:hypothetical protein